MTLMEQASAGVANATNAFSDIEYELTELPKSARIAEARQLVAKAMEALDTVAECLNGLEALAVHGRREKDDDK